MLVLREKKCLQ